MTMIDKMTPHLGQRYRLAPRGQLYQIVQLDLATQFATLVPASWDTSARPWSECTDQVREFVRDLDSLGVVSHPYRA